MSYAAGLVGVTPDSWRYGALIEAAHARDRAMWNVLSCVAAEIRNSVRAKDSKVTTPAELNPYHSSSGGSSINKKNIDLLRLLCGDPGSSGSRSG